MSVTDARLAELIADYGETCKRPPFECLSEVLACLRELQTRRGQEREMARKTAESYRQLAQILSETGGNPYSIASYKAAAEHFERAILAPAGETED